MITVTLVVLGVAGLLFAARLVIGPDARRPRRRPQRAARRGHGAARGPDVGHGARLLPPGPRAAGRRRLRRHRDDRPLRRGSGALSASTAVGHVGLLFGALLILVAAIGVVVFPDALTRMHALTMASTAGVAVSLIAVAVAMGTVGEVTSLLFATALQAATNPVASTLLAQATYYAKGVATRVDSVDQLAEAAPPSE